MINTEAMDTITSRLDKLEDEVQAIQSSLDRLNLSLAEKLERTEFKRTLTSYARRDELPDLSPFATKEQITVIERSYARKSELPQTTHLALRNELALTRVSEETVFLKADRPLGEERMEEIIKSVEKDRRSKGFKAGIIKSFEFIRAGAAYGEHRGPLYVVEYLGIG